MRKLSGILAAILLVALVLLTAMRFAHTGSRWPALLASISFVALPGFLVALVVFLLLLRGAPHWRWPAVGAGVAAVGLVLQASWAAPLLVGGSGQQPDLIVMTSNLEFGRGDAATVVRTVASDGVDVLVLEEVTPSELARLGAAGLAELLPYRVGTPATSASGTMAFSRYRLGSATRVGVRNGGFEVRVDAPEPFRLLAVHTAQPVGWPRPWLSDLETVRARAGAAVEQGPTIVVGDFNATRDHQPFRAVLGVGLRDAAEQAGSGWQPTWPSRWRQGWHRPLITIDHVLTSGRFRAVRTHTVQVRGTDHLALVVGLRVRAGELATPGPAGQ